MTVRELSEKIGATICNPGVGDGQEVRAGYACDLLSWVMTHGAPGTAWVTVMTHMNSVAVATLLEFSCLIAPEGIDIAPEIVEKATEEGLAVLTCQKTAYEIAGILYAGGVMAPVRG